jgi:2-dehydropantoate 2-reductase
VRAVVIGAGAVGLGVGSALLASGAEVVFVRRLERGPAGTSATAGDDPLERHGLERSGVLGRVRIARGRLRVVHGVEAAAARMRTLAGGALDWILVCTPSHASDAVAHAVAKADWGGEPRVALFQNGWGNAERFAAHIDQARIFCARVITGFALRSAHEVEVTVHADAIRVGSLFGEPAERAADLCRAIARGGIPCEPSAAIERDLWAKLLYNGALNPLGALLGVPYGELGRRPETRAVMETVVREIFAVMTASGHGTHWPDPDAYLEEFYGRLLPTTALHESSMLRDLRAGRRTEIDAISGAVVALGEQHGVAAPCNRALCDLVRAIQPRDRAPMGPAG